MEGVIFLRTPPSSTKTKSASPLLDVVVPALELPVVITVPLTSGNVIERSAVGSTTRRAVSNASAVAPSKTIDCTNELPLATPSKSCISLLNSTRNSSRDLSGVTALAVIAIILYSLILLIEILFRASLT